MLTAVVAAESGEIFELEGYYAAGMSGSNLVILEENNTIDMPYGSELMLLPNRNPLVYNPSLDRFEIIKKNPYAPEEKVFPVAVFNSPGYVNRFFCAYDNEKMDDFLPLFSYGAVGYGKKGFQSAAIQVDREPRQDLRLMPQKGVRKGVKQMVKQFPDNRLVRHLEKCALEYGCPAGKNFFLKRYEAPLPTSVGCNAACLGCISLQTENNLCACQERIGFTPTPGEIAQVALAHIQQVKNSVVSFGQGCEGEPLTAFKVILEAVRKIREETDQGTINLNTNASRPDCVDQLCRSGLDAMRVSMNSVREDFYTAYFRPVTYGFADVLQSIEAAKQHGKFVAINYLNCPGFTDAKEESEALVRFVDTYKIDMIQWRNLNFDPVKYIRIMSKVGESGQPEGMDTVIQILKKKFPKLRHGYFNPPKSAF